MSFIVVHTDFGQQHYHEAAEWEIDGESWLRIYDEDEAELAVWRKWHGVEWQEEDDPDDGGGQEEPLPEVSLATDTNWREVANGWRVSWQGNPERVPVAAKVHSYDIPDINPNIDDDPSVPRPDDGEPGEYLQDAKDEPPQRIRAIGEGWS